VSRFDKMLLINVAFSLFYLGFQEVADELLEMLGSAIQMWPLGVFLAPGFEILRVNILG
jgi:hypothetical protein